MLRYALAATALKALSVNDATRGMYRRIGNTVGSRRRHQADLNAQNYLTRGSLLVRLLKQYGGLRAGDRVFELGTGWMHFYAVYVRLSFDVRTTTFDVWDNRQFAALMAAFAKLRRHLEAEPGSAEAIATLDRVLAARTFDDVYGILNFTHVIVPDGSLAQFREAEFAASFSMHVLEHVRRQAVPALVRDLFRTLTPGAVTIHQIGIDDHLAHYDRLASPKQYISYSNRMWSTLFENGIQYFNRLQRSDWIRIFQEAGFVLLHEEVEATDLEGLKVSPSFAHYTRDDLACTILTVAFRRP
jgi:cyclopropane fatty-acyl-phospholipid synthase-like methyltransferase